MSQEQGFKRLDRRTFTTDEDESRAEEMPEEEHVIEERPTYVQELEARTRQAEEQLKRYIRAYKEEVEVGLEKTKERLQREKEREIERLRAELALDLLEVLDNLDRSLQAVTPESDVTALAKGVCLVRDQFFKKLQKMGLALVEAAGQRFDPREHEAVATIQVSDPAQDGQVVAVLKPGYRLGERLVRPAMVQVGRLQS